MQASGAPPDNRRCPTPGGENAVGSRPAARNQQIKSARFACFIVVFFEIR
jgi:hypothetical protein